MFFAAQRILIILRTNTYVNVDRSNLYPSYQDSIMTEWKITVVNKTGEDSVTGEGSTVSVVLFQSPPQTEDTDTHPCAWVVEKIAYPGEIYEICLPNEFELAIIDDHEANGSERITGPFSISSGASVYLTQKCKADPPTYEIKGKAMANDSSTVRVYNNEGNVQSLQMVLWKKGKKLIQSNKILPGHSVHLGVQPKINIGDVGSINVIREGDSLEDYDVTTLSKGFKLLPSNPFLTIDVHQKASGELTFEAQQ